MKIAFLASRFPYPLDKGDKVRAYHQIKHLSKKHSVYLICLAEGDVLAEHIAHLQSFCADIKIYPIHKPGIALGMVSTLFTGLPFQVGYFYRSAIKKSIYSDLDTIKPDAIVCQLLRMAEYVKDYQHPNKVLDYMDVFSADMLRRKQVSSGPEKLIFGAENERVLKYERDVFPYFQKHTIISRQDRDLLPVADNKSIEVIPNGIDFDYNHTAKPTKHYDILFFGNMGYTSNVESAVFLAQKVVPILVKQFPNIKVLIAGAEPHKRVLALQNNQVEVSGWIDDKWACYASARIFAAPMLISVGMQNKILEAMAVSVPCVVTTMANNAIGAEYGKEILVADSPEDFAAAIAQLLNNEDFAAQTAANAHAFITHNYLWAETVERLESYILK
jgi:sugar transferase (PEP-CTERM/EpsH1 system associated)